MTALVLLAVAAPPPAQHAAVATRLFQRGDRAGAERAYRVALKDNPPYPVRLAAKHGLAVCRLRADPPDWKEATDLLGDPAGDNNYPDRGPALELLAAGLRERATADGDGKRWEARNRLGDAERWYVERKQPADAARCRCGMAELDLRLNRPAEARDLVAGFLTDKLLTATPSRGRGLHLLGLAGLRLNDLPAAERALGRVPAGDPARPDADFLLGVIRLRGGEPADAASQFRAAGDHPGARFQLGVLAFTAGRFAEALDRFSRLPGAEPATWAGASLVRLGRPAEAVAALAPLPPTDQTARWLGEARLGLPEGAGAAVESLRRAVELADAVPDHLDPLARPRRADHRLALADALGRAGKHQEAADQLRRVLDENARPAARDDTLLRLVDALARAKKWDEADGRAEQFRRECPASPLLPALARRHAAAAVARAAAVPADRRDERRQRWEQAAERSRATELGDDPAARVGLATALRALGRYSEAAAAVDGVGGADGLRGDCLLRAGDAAGAATALAGADGPMAGLARGHALLQLGRLADARAAFAELIVTHPDAAVADQAAAAGAYTAARLGDAAALDALPGPLAAVYRAMYRPADAVRLLADAREKFGGTGDLPALLTYRLGLARAASGEWDKARELFDGLAGQARGQAVGAAAGWRAGLCRLRPADDAFARNPSDQTRDRVRDAAEELVRRAEELRGQPGEREYRPRLYLDAARAHARLSAWEAGRALSNDRRHRRWQWAEHGGHGPPPAVSPADVAVQGAEWRAGEVVKRLAEEFPATGEAAAGRLLVADLKLARGDRRAAARLLAEVADGEGPAAAAARVRRGEVLAEEGDLAGAVAAVEGAPDPVAADRLAGWLVATGQGAKAVVACGPEPSLRRGEALAAAGRADEAAAVFSKLDGSDARYGSGWAAVRRGRLDEAVDQLRQTSDPRGRVLLGLVRAAHNRRDEAAAVLLAVRAGDGVPAEVEWAARLEAARVLGDPDMLRRLVLDLPGESDWCVAAAERLAD